MVFGILRLSLIIRMISGSLPIAPGSIPRKAQPFMLYIMMAQFGGQPASAIVLFGRAAPLRSLTTMGAFFWLGSTLLPKMAAQIKSCSVNFNTMNGISLFP